MENSDRDSGRVTVASGLSDMIRNFARSLKEHVKDGGRHVTPNVYAQRMAICTNCPHFKKDSSRCGICGCYMPLKGGWRTSECPDSPKRWEKINGKG